MPELPEVETTRRGLLPHVLNRRIRTAVVRNSALRLPVPRELPKLVAGATIESLRRRGKYLLFECARGTLIVHLGMSGRLWIASAATPVERHDHLDLVMDNGTRVRLRDPRRFGLVLWQPHGAAEHALLAALGPEPLSRAFDGNLLFELTRSRSAAIKLVLMDSRVVAGVGNIYANEALFRAGIDPRTAAHRLSRARCARLACSIRDTLEAAIRAGGSTLRDYVGGDGRAGYFQNEFLVYGRAHEPCLRCGAPVATLRQGQRSTFYCAACQRR
jgi:formamidopyrimidine-DNA glycosylase